LARENDRQVNVTKTAFPEKNLELTKNRQVLEQSFWYDSKSARGSTSGGGRPIADMRRSTARTLELLGSGGFEPKLTGDPECSGFSDP
jgi:hypothetical protein